MLPDCLDLRGANLRIVADQWHGESNSGGSDDSVRQVGHLVTRYTSQSIGDCAVEWNQRTRTRRIIQRLNKCFPHDSRQAMFLDQIGELNETDRRNENGIARSRCAVEGLSRPYRGSSSRYHTMVWVSTTMPGIRCLPWGSSSTSRVGSRRFPQRRERSPGQPTDLSHS